jgi:hypothetical protein
MSEFLVNSGVLVGLLAKKFFEFGAKIISTWNFDLSAGVKVSL